MLTRYLFILSMLALVSWKSTLHAEESPAQPGLISLDFDSNRTTITADKLILHSKSREFSYLDNVKVVQADMTITCQRLDGSYTETNEIQTLTALNDVEIIKGENIKAYGNRADFLAENETIELTESPRVEQDGSNLAADKIIIYINEDRSEAIGNVQVTMQEKAGTLDQENDKKPANKKKKKSLL